MSNTWEKYLGYSGNIVQPSITQPLKLHWQWCWLKCTNTKWTRQDTKTSIQLDDVEKRTMVLEGRAHVQPLPFIDVPSWTDHSTSLIFRFPLCKVGEGEPTLGVVLTRSSAYCLSQSGHPINGGRDCYHCVQKRNKDSAWIKVWRGWGETRRLRDCWWDSSGIAAPENTEQFPPHWSTGHAQPCCPATALLLLLPREMKTRFSHKNQYMKIFISFIHKSPKMETTCMSFRGVNGQTNSGASIPRSNSHNKEWTTEWTQQPGWICRDLREWKEQIQRTVQ